MWCGAVCGFEEIGSHAHGRLELGCASRVSLLDIIRRRATCVTLVTESTTAYQLDFNNQFCYIRLSYVTFITASRML